MQCSRPGQHSLLHEQRVFEEDEYVGILRERTVRVRLYDLLDGAPGVEGLRHRGPRFGREGVETCEHVSDLCARRRSISRGGINLRYCLWSDAMFVGGLSAAARLHVKNPSPRVYLPASGHFV
jgi:hypothetical protein